MVKIPYCAHSHSIRGPLMSRFKIILVKMGTIFANFCQIQLLLCIVPTTTSILLRRKILNRIAAQSDQFIAILLCKLTLLSIEVDTNLSLSHCLHHEREKKAFFFFFVCLHVSPCISPSIFVSVFLLNSLPAAIPSILYFVIRFHVRLCISLFCTYLMVANKRVVSPILFVCLLIWVEKLEVSHT